ncbi:MAG TPA: asparagine synthase (glutamine-hydrolyzing) [Polyangiaceae bacterium]|nr:asparagine synthase (glutamine-hydrolyzing) [Polyangiaceae bacterium]
MCGIFGSLVTGARAEEARPRGLLDEALAALAHRGPDDRGAFEAIVSQRGEAGVHCAFAHTRLSIVDLSPSGRQPMSTEDGRFTLVYNGEVYNHRAIRQELEALGDRFRGSSDTEVVLRALARWGPSALARFRGMFALGLFDAETGSLLLGRDRLGIKPLYYAASGAQLSFASEIRALLHARLVPRRLSPWALDSFLAFGSVAEPATLIDGVRALPPGSMLELREGAYTIRPYWDLSIAPEETSFGAAVESIRPILRDAVRLMLIADVPVGIFLSGGVDSSALVSLAAASSTSPVHTFTVTFDEAEYSEASHAAEVARRFGCDHHQVHLPASEAARSIDAAVAALDQPSADGINTYFVSRAARGAGLSVALSGLGADEIFAGYGRFRLFGSMLSAARAASFAAPFARSMLSRMGGWPGAPLTAQKLALGLSTRGEPEAMYAAVRTMFTESQRRALIAPGLVDEVMRASAHVPACVAPEAPGASDPVNVFSAFELTNYVRNTLLRDTDVMSMAHALEVRVPFLDHELVERVLRVPGRLKVRRGATKPLLAAAVPDLGEGALRRPKMGFTLPFDAWFRGPLRPWMEGVLLGGPVRRQGILRPSAVEGLWGAFLRSTRPTSHARVWSLAALSAFCEANRIAP